MQATQLVDRQRHDLGGGFVVGRVMPNQTFSMVGPFIFFDHLGPLELAPGIPRNLDVRPHPHMGLSTVTYLLDGNITHRDSLGSEQDIRPGEVNWMIAGRGVTHSERLEYARRHGANMHGIQAWVALPDDAEDSAPQFHHHEGANELPELHEQGVDGRLLAGRIEGEDAAVKTHSPMFYMHWDMAVGSQRSLGTEYSERAVYAASGEIEVDGHHLPTGRMAVLPAGRAVDIKALSPARVMLLGGEPVGHRYRYWNFVSSSKDRIEQACEDWRAQRMALPGSDNKEFIPLPDNLGPIV